MGEAEKAEYWERRKRPGGGVARGKGEDWGKGWIRRKVGEDWSRGGWGEDGGGGRAALRRRRGSDRVGRTGRTRRRTREARWKAADSRGSQSTDSQLTLPAERSRSIGPK